MGSTLKKTAILGTSSALALAGIAGGFVAAIPNTQAQAGEDPVATQEANEAYLKTDIVTTDAVAGNFSFTQTEVSSNEQVAAIAADSKYLCNRQGFEGVEPQEAVGSWTIEVKGAVKTPLVTTFEEMAQSDAVQRVIMSCNCMGNPADGKAVSTAEVTGIPVSVMVSQAGVQGCANTIVFASSDGYEVALPLDYVMGRYCPIVFDINGAPLAESVGGVNQLWLGATSANYFARDIVSITLEERQTPPPAPSSDEAREAYQNLPNVGILYGGDVR